VGRSTFAAMATSTRSDIDRQRDLDAARYSPQASLAARMKAVGLAQRRLCLRTGRRLRAAPVAHRPERRLRVDRGRASHPAASLNEKNVRPGVGADAVTCVAFVLPNSQTREARAVALTVPRRRTRGCGGEMPSTVSSGVPGRRVGDFSPTLRPKDSLAAFPLGHRNRTRVRCP
jgi:hypothetical protein